MPAEITALYKSPDGAANNGPVCIGSILNLTATSVSGASYVWTGPNGFTSTLQNPTLVYSAANAGVYTLQVTSGNCTATAYTNVTSSSNAGQWTGSVSTDWADGNNWCNGAVPTSATNVIITAGATRMPSVISSVFCNSITVNSGASLTITSTGTLNIAGTLTSNGAYTDNGTTVFNGTSGQQTFSGVTTFNNLTLNNTGGLLLSASVAIKSNLTLTAGTFNSNDLAVSVAGNWINNASATAFSAGIGTVTFNGTAAQVVAGTFATTFNHLTISNTVSTVSLNVNANIAGNLLVTTGTFDLGPFTADRTTTGGTLTVANNASLKIGGTGTFPFNYTGINLSVASTVEYAGTNQSVANQLYGNLTFSSASGAAVKTLPASSLTITGNLSSTVGSGTAVTFAAASNVNVSGNFIIGASTTFNGGSFTDSVRGSWVNSGTFNGGTGTVTFTGPGSTVSGTGIQNFNNINFAASGVTFSSASITLTGNLATTGSGSCTQGPGGTLLMTGSSTTISGMDISLNNLTVAGSVTTSSSFTLSGNLTVNGNFTASNNTIVMSGAAKTISGTGTILFYVLYPSGAITANTSFSIGSSLNVVGSFTASAGTATFTGSSSLNGTANLNDVTINGTSLQLSTGSVLGIAGALTITSGTLNVTTSGPNTVNFNGAVAQSINGITYSNLILSNGSTKTAVASLTTLYDITIGAATTFNLSSYTCSVYGNWINNGAFMAGTSTVQFVGPATAYVTGATIFNILTSNTTNATTELILQSNVQASVVNMTNGIIFTGADTITITTTRTGPGFIYGNIRRTHAFTTGVAYAFEGPDNTITFASVTGVSSVFVSVTEGQVSDFPFGGSISRVYDIRVPTGTYNATLRLHYEDDELNGNNEASMTLWHYNGLVWGSIGKSANSTTANYVEQSGLTDITNCWTCSDNANLVQWNGSVSSDWNTAANWTVLQGAGSMPPSASDIVDLGTAAFTNQPTITTAVTVKNIIFGSTQSVILTLGSGGSLITSGDINGTWTANATHSINVNNQTLSVNGNIGLSDGTAGHAINLIIGAGTVTTLGSLVQSGGANITFSGAGILNIYQNFTYGSGVFTPGNGTVIYNGTQNQQVANVSYNNLSISKTAGLAAINDSVSIAGSLMVSSGELDNCSTTRVAGDVNISTGGTFYNYSLLHVKGNWNNSGSYVPTGSSIFFDGAGTQTISASTFNNLEINKPVGSLAVLTGDVILNGNLVGTSGTLDSKSFFFNRLVIGGTATIKDSATLVIAADNAPNKFATYSLAPNSTVKFNGTGIQHLQLPGVVYGNLTLSNTGSKILYTSVTVMNKLLIENPSTFNAGANTITLNGDWQNDGTFIPSASTLLLTGTVKTISGNNMTFNKVTVTGNYTMLNDITFDSLLTISSTGAFYAGSARKVTLNGDLSVYGTWNIGGSVTLTGNRQQTLTGINASLFIATEIFNGSVPPVLHSTSTPQFSNIIINNTGGVSPTTSWIINRSLTIGSGALFNAGPSSHTIYGDVTNNGAITSSGTLSFLPSTAATINLGTNFSSTGRVYFGGAGAMTLAGTPASFANVNINNTNLSGVTPSSAWNIAKDLRVVGGSILNAGSYMHLVGGNISNSGTINAGSGTFALNGTATQDISSASAFNNLTVNKASGVVTLSSNITANGTINFVAGNIQTGNYSLMQPSSGTISGAAQSTGWVNGKLQKGITTGASVKTFEIGDAAGYTPVSLAISGATSAGNITASTTGNDHPALSSSVINPNKDANRFWTLANSGVQLSSYSATFNFLTGDIDAGANTSNFGVQLYNGSSWSSPGTASPNPTSIQGTGITSFGDFAAGEVCNAGTTISYTGSPYCTNGGTALVTRTGTGGGTYSSSAGLSIDSTTGSINLGASTPGTYSVRYDVNATGGCQVYVSAVNIIITAAPAATIAYSATTFCINEGTAVMTRTGTSGGAYSSTAGLAINTATGNVTLATTVPGTYTVTYLVAATAGCSQYQTTTTITVQSQSIWTGAVSTDYNVAGNWLCGGVPTALSSVVIPSGLTVYHVSPPMGGSFYRIRSIGRNNQTILSRTVHVSFDGARPSVVIYPNPFTNQKVNVQFNSMAQGLYELSLYDRFGKKVTAMTLHHGPADESRKVHISTFLAAGMYYLRIDGDHFSASKKVFVE